MTESSEHVPEQQFQQEDIVIAGEKLLSGSFKRIDGESVPVTTLNGNDGTAEVIGEGVIESGDIPVKIIGLSNGELGLVPSSDQRMEGQDELLSPEELNEQTRKTLKGVGRGLLAAFTERFVGSRVRAYNAQGDGTPLDPDQPTRGLTPVTEIDPTGEKPQRVVAHFKNNSDSLPNQQ